MHGTLCSHDQNSTWKKREKSVDARGILALKYSAKILSRWMVSYIKRGPRLSASTPMMIPVHSTPSIPVSFHCVYLILDAWWMCHKRNTTQFTIPSSETGSRTHSSININAQVTRLLFASDRRRHKADSLRMLQTNDQVFPRRDYLAGQTLPITLDLCKPRVNSHSQRRNKHTGMEQSHVDSLEPQKMVPVITVFSQ